ncbi:MAG: metallophosphoesterase [Euryarchaeota archaeon]|nr:metallophosphoesterase [Euryarchaeota archaeon]
MNCIFVSDLHGKIKRYESLFEILLKEKPDAVFLGGDLLPNQLVLNSDIIRFIDDEIFSNIKKTKKDANKNMKFFVILGNDDPRVYEKIFISADKKGIINYVHNKTAKCDKLYVSGYAYVPPTPFQLKDWERYDVSQYVDVGAISPEKGKRTVDVPADEIKYTTIAEDLEELTKNSPSDNTIFLFHSPPYNSLLDRADLHGKMVDHAPMDIHVGSIAIQKFIDKKQPFLTLHGHVHESARLTGHWKERFGKTFSFTAAHDGPELALIRFDTDDLKNATRELIAVS